MNLARVRFLSLCVLPLALPLFAACNGSVDERANAAESNVDVAAQAVISESPIAGGNSGSLRLKSDGTVWGWGSNDSGQLGDGTTTDRVRQVQVSGLSGVTSVSAGEGSFSLALKSDGTVWSFGSNLWHELGAGVNADQYTPVQVVGLSSVVAVSAANVHSLALKSDGTVWSWGFNSAGQLGDGTTTNRETPVQVSALSSIVAVSATHGHSLALKSDGTVWSFGRNDHGELGDGTTTNRATPVQVSGLSDVTAIAAGSYYSLALTSDGTVMAWGINSHGELGDGTTTQRLTPVQVGGLSGVTVTAVSAFQSSLALTSDGTIMAWGFNSHGQLGDGTTTNRTTPVHVLAIGGYPALSGVTALAAGDRHSLAQMSDGTVVAWGANTDGQLGDGTTTDRHTPVNAGIVSVSIGLDCAGATEILETIEAAGCVNLSSATIAAGPSMAFLHGPGTYTLYEGLDCTGGKRQTSSDTYFCGYTYDNEDELNDNAKSISFP